MVKYVSHLILVLFFPTLIFAGSEYKRAEISFYSETLSLDYHSSIILDGLLILDELALVEYYERMEATNHQPLLNQLQNYRIQYRLNDWLYYELLRKSVDLIYEREGPLKKEISLWFLLTKSGYDTRLSYVDNQVYIYAWSEEDIFETPMIRDENRRFINLSSINQAKGSSSQLKLLLYRPGSEQGQPFSFKLTELPSLRPQIANRSLSFKINDRNFNMEVEVDKTIFEVMKNYPSIAEDAYFEVPMSEITYKSLIPRLKFMVKNLNNREALQILVAFTRTAFEYKDDQEVFGRSRPMIAEELLHYPYSDCEDRSALFYYLVKEILGLPMLIVAYPDHLTIAVAEDQIEGLAIEHAGQQYFICDPTGPKESNIIGLPPAGYESIPFEILNRQKE
jgi:hypothetical protein